VNGELDDLLGLADHAWDRLMQRLAGLTDSEWRWRPDEREPRVSIGWRLGHLRTMLADERNWRLLALDGAPPPAGGRARAADESRERLVAAFAALRAALAGSALDLGAQIGPAAGPYAASTRRSYLLHVIDELIHHAAEVALLRDLYAARA
jgi:hypothetical protein